MEESNIYLERCLKQKYYLNVKAQPPNNAVNDKIISTKNEEASTLFVYVTRLDLTNRCVYNDAILLYITLILEFVMYRTRKFYVINDYIAAISTGTVRLLAL